MEWSVDLNAPAGREDIEAIFRGAIIGEADSAVIISVKRRKRYLDHLSPDRDEVTLCI